MISRFFSFLFFLSLAAQASELPIPQIEQLPNGLQVVWFVSDKLPIVDFDLTLKSGSRDDLPGKSGAAELVAATLDRGVAGMSRQEFAKAIESLGAQRGAAVEDDFFRVSMHGLAADSETLFEFLAKMVLHPDFPEAELSREKSRMIDGYSRLADYGDSLVDLTYRRAMTQGTPYGRGAFLSIPEFSQVGRQDVLNYYHRNFVPKNAVLMVVGRVDQNRMRERIKNLFGSWSGGVVKRSKKNYSALPGHGKSGEILLMNRPDLTQAQVRVGFRAPLVQDSRHYALAVGNALLGEYFHSRLNTLIRDQLGLTYGIGSSFSFDRDLSILTISSATRNETVGVLIEKTLGVLKGLKDGPLPEEEVQTAQAYLVGGFPVANSTLESIAGRWLTDYLFDLGPNRLNQYIPGISSVSAADVLSAMNAAIDLSRLTIAVAGDAKVIAPVLKKSGYNYQEISVKKLLNGFSAR